MDIEQSFATWFGHPPNVRAEAPGRVNLMGEHTDYNGGWVLPLALPLTTQVALAKHSQPRIRVQSAQFPGEGHAFDLADLAPKGDWLDYLRGCVGVLRERGAQASGMDLAISSTVPLGAGLSSSASLCIALLRGLSKLWDHTLDPVAAAQAAQRIEHEWAGANVGIMDPMAASLGRPDAALYLDTVNLNATHCPIPAGMEFLVIHSGTRHTHAGGDYNKRRSECEAAAKALGVRMLCELDRESSGARCDKLPAPLRRRAVHVIEENARVHEAAAALMRGDAQSLADLFTASHASQRDLYDVSVPAIETLVQTLGAQPAILGTRLTGGGFGGSVVSVAKAGNGVEAAHRAIAAASSLGVRAKLLNVTAPAA